MEGKGDTDLIENIDIEENFGNIDCVIYEIKNGTIFERNMI